MKARSVYFSSHTNKSLGLLVKDEELFVPYSEFPWFKQATIEPVVSIERPRQNHLEWPLPDMDLSLESIRNPDRFPLISIHGR
ncbi:MAG: DUF2442 domain-containing protein [Sulfuriferula sp.]